MNLHSFGCSGVLGANHSGGEESEGSGPHGNLLGATRSDDKQGFTAKTGVFSVSEENEGGTETAKMQEAEGAKGGT